MIAVVVVTYNGLHCIQRCLESLYASELKPHVIVVDNASTDGTLLVLNSQDDRIEFLPQAKNLGFGVGNNIGIQRALARGARYIYLLNQDALAMPGSIAAMQAYMDTNPTVGVVSPLHMSPTAETIDAKTYEGYLRVYAADWLRDAALGRARESYPIRGVNAAAWFVRAEVFNRVGGFDPLFFMYGEDDDMLNRMAYHQVQFKLLPGVRALHLRESPPSASAPGFFADVGRRAVKLRSNLVLRAKLPGLTLTHSVLQVVSHGVLLPLVAWLSERDSRHCCAMLLASAQTLRHLLKIRRHAELCASPGAHFLNSAR